jgi:retron-type reverse transcriptase
VEYGETLKRVESNSKGIIQGGNLSPLLSNIYMHEFDE